MNNQENFPALSERRKNAIEDTEGSAPVSVLDSVRAGLFGFCVGDALGVPYEFSLREDMTKNPATGMTGYGTWSQPKGTWSDDSSLTFCTCEALIYRLALVEDYSVLLNPRQSAALAMHNFLHWYYHGYWTAQSRLFDVGRTTEAALENFNSSDCQTIDTGLFDEYSNGNGSLMRMLPLAYLHNYLNFTQLIEWAAIFSHPTHAHPRSKIACGVYVLTAARMLKGQTPLLAFMGACNNVFEYYSNHSFRSEINRDEFVSLFSGVVSQEKSTGYVIDTLNAVMFCVLNSASYRDTVLAAVNLGGDTDTIAALAGGLAGIAYGYNSIPTEWLGVIARRNDIEDLCTRFAGVLENA